MNLAEISRAIAALPLTVENMQAVIGMTMLRAQHMHTEAGVTGADQVHEYLTDAYAACDRVWPISDEERGEFRRDETGDMRNVLVRADAAAREARFAA